MTAIEARQRVRAVLVLLDGERPLDDVGRPGGAARAVVGRRDRERRLRSGRVRPCFTRLVAACRCLVCQRRGGQGKRAERADIVISFRMSFPCRLCRGTCLRCMRRHTPKAREPYKFKTVKLLEPRLCVHDHVRDIRSFAAQTLLHLARARVRIGERRGRVEAEGQERDDALFRSEEPQLRSGAPAARAAAASISAPRRARLQPTSASGSRWVWTEAISGTQREDLPLHLLRELVRLLELRVPPGGFQRSERTRAVGSAERDDAQDCGSLARAERSAPPRGARSRNAASCTSGSTCTTR